MCAGILAFMLVSAAFFAFHAKQRIYNPEIEPLTKAEEDMARSAYFTSLSANTDAPDLFPFSWPDASIALTRPKNEIEQALGARSAILLDASTGEVLLEKNADEQIPPASMTKLVAMYTAFKAVAAGEITFDDVVALPPESWAVNIPAGSSLMFLGAGQHVTVRELLLGMAIASGNDAAIALAIHVSGSVPSFVERMNEEMTRLGLVHTHFVEPSGLSELNMTTAREFADFARIYVEEFPEALKAFHSQTKLEYPMSWNLPEGSRDSPVVQYATNKLLAQLEGCDGLKTGYIRESGYNLSLTAERNGTRFISVTMGGPGSSTNTGSMIRNRDGSSLVEWAFGNFATVKPEAIEPMAIPVWEGLQRGIKAIPAQSPSYTAPRQVSDEKDEISMKTPVVVIPKSLEAPIEAGDVIGRVEYRLNGIVVHTVPLIADRSVLKTDAFSATLDRVTRGFALLLHIID